MARGKERICACCRENLSRSPKQSYCLECHAFKMAWYRWHREKLKLLRDHGQLVGK